LHDENIFIGIGDGTFRNKAFNGDFSLVRIRKNVGPAFGKVKRLLDVEKAQKKDGQKDKDKTGRQPFFPETDQDKDQGDNGSGAQAVKRNDPITAGKDARNHGDQEKNQRSAHNRF